MMGIEQTAAPNPITPACWVRAPQAAWLVASVLFLLPSSLGAQAQFDGRKTEVGVQFSLFRQSDRFSQIRVPLMAVRPDGVSVVSVFPTVQVAVGQDAGFGGRLGYNFSDYVAAEGEANFFPTRRQSSGGPKTQALFGLKAGGRVDDFGLFAKVRPGLLHFNDLPEGGSDTNFALDVGAVVEYYPSRRTLVRVDLSDVIVQFDERTYSPPIGILSASGGVVFGNITDFLQQPTTPGTPTAPQPGAAPIRLSFRRPSDTTHNFQLSVGFGLRF